MTTTIDLPGDEPISYGPPHITDQVVSVGEPRPVFDVTDTHVISVVHPAPPTSAPTTPASSTHLASAPVTTQVARLTVGAQEPTAFGTGMGATQPQTDRPRSRVAETPRAIGATTQDDTLSFWGSFAGSFALTWMLYYQILPFSGKVGFVICWFFVFLAMYAGVTAIGNPRLVVVDRLVSAIVRTGAFIVFGTLATAIFFTFQQGIEALVHTNFFTTDMAGVRPTSSLDNGGIVHAILGSMIEVGIAIAITLPLGIGCAVYMNEVGGKFARVVRTLVEAMTALPSIVAGLFIYTVLIVMLGVSRTGIAASMAIAVMMLPIIARSADVVLRVMPGGLREASLALGASKWQTVRQVVIPTVRPGLATALILGIARGVGETSPVLLTSGASSFTNVNPFNEPMNSLPLFVFSAVRSGEPLFIARGFGAASVLLLLVLLLFVFTRYLARQKVGSR
jgi:phosphate transport system permease protein